MSELRDLVRAVSSWTEGDVRAAVRVAIDGDDVDGFAERLRSYTESMQLLPRKASTLDEIVAYALDAAHRVVTREHQVDDGGKPLGPPATLAEIEQALRVVVLVHQVRASMQDPVGDS